jgi:hypothetical protein
MSEAVTEPRWIEIASLGSEYDEELDVNAREGSPQQYRHRPTSFTGEPQFEWRFGWAPVKPDKVKR